MKPSLRSKLKIVLVGLLAGVLQLHSVAGAAHGPAQPRRAGRERDSPPPPLKPADRSAERQDEAERQAASIPANQRQIIQMLPQDERTLPAGGQTRARPIQCPDGLLTFELATGFIYKPAGSDDTLAMLPSTLQLTDCLEYCLQNSSCLAINFEMGLCVLLATSASENPQSLYSSQFPVFTIYAEKKCLLSGKFHRLQSAQNIGRSFRRRGTISARLSAGGVWRPPTR